MNLNGRLAPTSERPRCVLRVRQLEKTFPGTRALIDVDFEMRAGEIHALVGQNGSGKSTLIKVLAGYHAPDPGAHAEVEGQPYELGDHAAAQAAGLRFVHQDLGLVPTLDSVDNLALGSGYARGRLGRIRWREQLRITRRAIEAVGYDVDPRTPVERLEPIQRTAVAIARAVREIEGNARLLVLDEPTATMPQTEVERLFTIVRRLRDRGLSVLYVSHHLDEIFEIADRVTVLRDGRNVGTFDVAHLARRDLVEVMTGGFVETPLEHSGAGRGQPALEISGLAGRELRGIDLTLHAGEVVGIAGITGSGREEACALIVGARSRSGEVCVDGRRLAPADPAAAVAAGMSFVPADRIRDGLFPLFSVRENLMLSTLGQFFNGLRLRSGRERADARDSVLLFGVRTASPETPVASLSGGNQQKVLLGRCLRTKPRVLLLDEPTQGVDVAAKADVHRLIDEAAIAGSAVLVCSSDESELERLCDRVAVVRQGRIAAEFARPNISARRLAQETLGLDHAVLDGRSRP